MSGCAIAAIVAGAVALLAVVGIGVMAILVRDKVTSMTTETPFAAADEKATLSTTRADYVGEWTGPGSTLSITPGGHVAWQSAVDGSSESYEGELTGFRGADVVIGVMGLSFTLTVAKPPTRAGDTWTMTMEGVAITRPATGAPGPP